MASSTEQGLSPPPISACQLTLDGWRVFGSCHAPWPKHPHVLRLSIQRSPWSRCLHWLIATFVPPTLARALLPAAWILPAAIIVKKLKHNWDDEFANELGMYEKLQTLQGKQIPVCYGEACCHGTRALVLEDVGGVSLYHRSALVETSESQVEDMMLAAYRPMINLNILYDDWKLDNFNLVDGRIVFMDLELATELTFDPEFAIKRGRAALLRKWNRLRTQYEKYGEIKG